ncbi:MAG: YicC family protein [Bacteroidetes bacterium]|nr:YicC family protein [bacterium]NBP63140.1 YicC family protein [Bacteroidota bacterium]
MKSMTGFAKSEINDHGIHAIVEIKSVNGRYLEPTIKLPRTLSSKEIEVRDMLRKALNRGSVFVNVQVEYAEGEAKIPGINIGKAKAIHDMLKQLQQELQIDNQVHLNQVLTFSQHFIESEKDDIAEMQWNVVREAMKQALKALDTARTNEGNELSADMLMRINMIEQSLGYVEERSKTRIPEERERLRQKLSILLDNDEIEEHRLNQEIIILADKLDVSEESVRLRSHIKYFRELLNDAEPIGRKLNFLTQELNREINTIGSKANDADIARIVVGMKEELERIREQAQNIE